MCPVPMSLRTCLLWLLTLAGFSCANFPVFDLDTNMRIVLIPHDTPVGTIIYRVRASDSDLNFPLEFEVFGTLGKSLLAIKFLGCVESESLCQADVLLKKPLDMGRTYEFQIEVRDTMGDYTQVHASIISTMGSVHYNPLFEPRIMHLAEDCREDTILERFDILKNDINSRPVLLEIRDKQERIGLKQRLVSNNRTEGTLFLKKKLDYETQPWFTFQVLAMNAWTNTSIDTRNILVSDIMVAVHDVQDTPPVFTLLPASIELTSNLRMGDLIVKVEAEDGDKQNKRLIRYGFLTDSNPFVAFFDLDPMNGEIRLRRNITDLFKIAKPNEPIIMTVIAEEIIPENGRFGRSTFSPTMERTMGNITFWFGQAGTAWGTPTFSSDKYVGEVHENALPGTLVQFGSTSTLSVFHPNTGELITLSFQSGRESESRNRSPFVGPINYNQQNQHNMIINSFELIPSQGFGNLSFQVRIKDSKVLDYETLQEIKMALMASTKSGLSSQAEVTIHLRDDNDNFPVFEQSEYKVDIPEHSVAGTKVVVVKAMDKDTGSNGEIMYTNLVGSDAFHLNPKTGEITVDKPELLDRELEPEIRLYVEAKDGGYREFGDPSAIRNIATATVLVKLHDKNDNKPEFLQKYYQAVLTPDMTGFKIPLVVKAVDPDEGTNGQIKYQSMDSKFFVDPATGEVRLRGAYSNPNSGGGSGGGPYLGSFRIRAYDLGNPQQSSETVVQLFSEEMVTREIQFILPASPDKIRRNQTNIEKMLSSLTGGIVGIQKITSLSGKRAGHYDGTDNGRRLDNGGSYNDNNNNNWLQDDKDPSKRDPTSRSIDPPQGSTSNTGLSVRGQNQLGRSADSSEKSLVTATVQYPVSAIPTRVDLAAFQKEYGNGDDLGRTPVSKPPTDSDMIKLYEAENRALFWLLVSFLLILLLLFIIFLCCVYCPGCWLYGHCYSKGIKHEKEDRDKRSKPSRKTYPAEDTEDSGRYDNDPEAYRRGGPPPRRREAWSGDEKKREWRASKRYYRDMPPTPYNKGRGSRLQQRPQDGDIALEDWDMEPPSRNYSRLADRADEIGPRWQNMQHPHPMLGHQTQTITVPVPMSLMPIPVQQQIHQQMPLQQSQRHVAYIGHQHPGDDNYIRHPLDESPGQVSYQYMVSDMERSQAQIPRHYPGDTAPGPDDGKGPMQRETRFIKTETGEILQFADEGEEGKELLMKRYMNDQLQLAETASQPQTRSRPVLNDEQDPSSEGLPKRKGTTSMDRPRAAVISNRSQKGIKEETPPAPSPLDHTHTHDDIIIHDDETTSKIKHSKHSKSSRKGFTEDKKKLKQKRRERRSQSLSEESEDVLDKRKVKSRKSKSKSRSRSRSLSPSQKSKSPTPTPSPRLEEGKKDERKRRSKRSKDKEKVGETLTPVQVEPNVNPKIQIPTIISTSKDIDIDTPKSTKGGEVDINIIPPSSAAMTESDQGERKEQIKVHEQEQEENEIIHEHDDKDEQDSGIGITSFTQVKKKNKMLEKKSVFTIAYDEVAQRTTPIRPETGSGSTNEVS